MNFTKSKFEGKIKTLWDMGAGDMINVMSYLSNIPIDVKVKRSSKFKANNGWYNKLQFIVPTFPIVNNDPFIAEITVARDIDKDDYVMFKKRLSGKDYLFTSSMIGANIKPKKEKLDDLFKTDD